MKFLKGNQVIIYIIALMLITAGYLNYTTNNEAVEETSAQTNTSVETNTVVQDNTTQVGDIGDAALVNSNDVVTESSEPDIEPNDYYANSKIEREKMYSQMLEVYQNVLNSSSAQESQKQSATLEIQKINNTKNSIMICENLIKTKGFQNSVIFVNGDSINVIIGTVNLEKEQVAEIQNIIEREMNAEAKNIHISIN